MRLRLALTFLLGVLAAALLGCDGFHSGPTAVHVGMASAQDRARLVRGWSGQEGGLPQGRPAFSWIEGFSAKVSLGRVSRAGTATLRFKAWPFSPPGVERQELQVWLNSLFVGKRAMEPESSDYEFVFPARILGRERNDLFFVLSRATAPREVDPKSSDGRQLSAAVESIDLTIR
jgi:hypothetical protein